MNTGVCIDANLAIAFAFKREPLHPQAKAIIQQLSTQNQFLCAPAMFAYECDSVVRLKLYSGKITLAEAEEARELLNALGVVIEYDEDDRDRAFEISHQYDQPRAYDAAYAAHAETRGLDLLTIDVPFFEAVNGVKRPKTAKPLSFVKLIK